MFSWFKRRKFELIGSSHWVINWTDIKGSDKGQWLYFESKDGKRKFESTHVPYLYQGIGDESRLPGYSACVVWKNGGELPSAFIPLKSRGYNDKV